MGHRYTGRSPLDIALDNAAMYEKFARECAAELSYTRSRAFALRYGGYQPAEEKRLEYEVERYRRLAVEWIARAEEEEERGQ